MQKEETIQEVGEIPVSASAKYTESVHEDTTAKLFHSWNRGINYCG
jgi:hypothetical protein